MDETFGQSYKKSLKYGLALGALLASYSLAQGVFPGELLLQFAFNSLFYAWVIAGVRRIWLRLTRGSTQKHYQAVGDIYKRCPFCAELILFEAKVCKHCGRDLPLGAPNSQSSYNKRSVFYKLNQEQEITNDLHPSYKDYIKNGGALLGALRIKADVARESNPRFASAVNPHLVDVSFGYWDRPELAFLNHRSFWLNRMGKDLFKRWEEKGAALYSDPTQLIAWTLPLWVEAQMTVFALSPHRAQDVLLKLLELVLHGDTHEYELAFGKPQSGPHNMEIIVLLLWGKSVYVNTCHTRKTVENWSNELEAATALLIPQVIKLIRGTLDHPRQTFLHQTLEGLVGEWKKGLPEYKLERERREWVPRLDY